MRLWLLILASFWAGIFFADWENASKNWILGGALVVITGGTLLYVFTAGLVKVLQ